MKRDGSTLVWAANPTRHPSRRPSAAAVTMNIEYSSSPMSPSKVSEALTTRTLPARPGRWLRLCSALLGQQLVQPLRRSRSAPPLHAEPSMPSRSSVVWKTDTVVTLVRPSPMSSNVAVSTDTWPAMPSHSKVWTIRSGAVTSR